MMSSIRIAKMPPTMMPFLYQTRTLQSLRFARTFSHTVRRAAWPDKPEPEDEFNDPEFDHTSKPKSSRPDYTMPSLDNNLPFIGLEEAKPEPAPPKPHRQSTMSPTETETFRQIFDEISSGKMPKAKQMDGEVKEREMFQRTTKLLHEDEEKPKTLNFFQREAERIQSNIREQSIIEQARQLSDLKDKLLPSYPPDLQDAAKAALNLYKDGEREDGGLERLIPSKDQRQHQAKVEDLREQEQKRLDKAFAVCWTDVELWDLLEKEIFTLAPKLGLVADAPAPGDAKKKKKKNKRSQLKSKAEIAEQAFNMDVYGPLVSRYVNRALHLFDTAFACPSLRAYNLLPRLKSLGLSAYVLAVSTTFYTRLARIHWERHGDPVTALKLLEEMYSIGLTPNAETGSLLIEMQEELSKCARGDQGLFVAAVMDSPPYDGDLMQRLAKMEDEVRHALKDQGLPVQ